MDQIDRRFFKQVQVKFFEKEFVTTQKTTDGYKIKLTNYFNNYFNNYINYFLMNAPISHPLQNR